MYTLEFTVITLDVFNASNSTWNEFVLDFFIFHIIRNFVVTFVLFSRPDKEFQARQSFAPPLS